MEGGGDYFEALFSAVGFIVIFTLCEPSNTQTRIFQAYRFPKRFPALTRGHQIRCVIRATRRVGLVFSKFGVTKLSSPRRLLHGSAGHATKAFNSRPKSLLCEKSTAFLTYRYMYHICLHNLPSIIYLLMITCVNQHSSNESWLTST